MKIYLYTTTTDKRYVVKHRQNELELDIAFKMDTDIVNPSVELYDVANITKYNYAYIPSLKRYYFITNITFNDNEIATLQLHADILSSAWTTLKSITCMVKRQESYYSAKMPDDKLPVNIDRIVQYKNATMTENQYFFTASNKRDACYYLTVNNANNYEGETNSGTL